MGEKTGSYYFMFFPEEGNKSGKRGKTGLLENGTELFFVIESIADRSFSGDPYHYEIISGKITGRITGGYTEYRVPTTNRYGRTSCLEYLKTTLVGKSAFLTYDEARKHADHMTDKYEATWGYSLKAPLLRPWNEPSVEKAKGDICV